MAAMATFENYEVAFDRPLFFTLSLSLSGGIGMEDKMATVRPRWLSRKQSL